MNLHQLVGKLEEKIFQEMSNVIDPLGNDKKDWLRIKK